MGPTFEEQPDYESGSFFTAVLSFQVSTWTARAGCSLPTWWTQAHLVIPCGVSTNTLKGRGSTHLLPAALVKKANSRSTTQIAAQLLVRSQILYIYTWELILSDPSANSPDIKQTSCQFKCYTQNLQSFVKWVTATEPQTMVCSKQLS